MLVSKVSSFLGVGTAAVFRSRAADCSVIGLPRHPTVVAVVPQMSAAPIRTKTGPDQTIKKPARRRLSRSAAAFRSRSAQGNPTHWQPPRDDTSGQAERV